MTRREWKTAVTVARRTAVLAASLVGVMGCAMTDPRADAVAPPAAPASALGSYLAARHAQQEHDYAQAANFMERALVDDPGNYDLVRRSFVLRVSEGRIAEALPLARRIVDLDRNSGLAGLVLLLQDIKSADYAAAVNRANAMPRDGAQRYAVPLLVAWSEMGRQRPAPALRALDAVAELRGLAPLKDLHTALLADYADRIDEAEAAYKRLLAEGARPTWRTVEMAGNFYERHGRSEEARRLYERFGVAEREADLAAPGLERIAKGVIPARVVATPGDGAAEALFDLASLLNQRETVDASLVYARLALDLRPSMTIAKLLIAEIQDEQQHAAEALVLYREIEPASPFYWAARLRAAMASDALGRTDEAVADLKRMAAERPKRADPLIQLGDLLRSRSRYPEAVEAYDQAIPRIGTIDAQQWRIFYSRGVALERAGDWPRSEADLKRALELQPEQPLILNYLGYSWIDKGVNLDAALKMIRRAVELRPNDGYIVDSLGWAYYRIGDFANATQMLERAIELLPEDPTINDHLGDAFWQSGRLAEARFQWRRALQFKPEADQVQGIEGKLDRGLNRPPAAAAARGG